MSALAGLDMKCRRHGIPHCVACMGKSRGRMTDTERLNFLDSLMKRTEYQNMRRPSVGVDSDMHINSHGNVALYARDLCGRVVAAGSAENVRDAIDQCAAGLSIGLDAA